MAMSHEGERLSRVEKDEEQKVDLPFLQ